ncbi:hypothetical protein F5J12DRAFT_859672 [Pisolithus orientalis]|uniref:uncharacterized protein n=1 Tax=Pisolithus orientalis TaxID=936130 RepID=UPI0022256158|nr:uncharacterized protein F5J12DRAFT_859672 [Pisolithus orientalis]KAI5992592.1 hypothetical protein F5J12DRAFT_859672 [Pisolithus orientalis]
MARTQSKKRRLLGFAKTANSTASLALPPGRLQARAGDVGPVSETSGMTSLGMFARMKRFFHRSNKGLSTTIATEAAGTVPCAEAQGQGHLHHAGPVQEVTVDTDTGGGTQERREGLEVTPIQDTKKLTNRLEPEPATAAIGKDVDAAVKAFDDMGSMSRIGKGAVDAVGRADSAVIEAQNMSDTYLKPFKVFNQVVTTLTNMSVPVLRPCNDHIRVPGPSLCLDCLGGLNVCFSVVHTSRKSG